MTRCKLSNVLLDDSEQFLAAPTLLVRSTSRVFRTDDRTNLWRLSGPGVHDFTTFFNALSVQKWKEYTVARRFYLHLELRGPACEVRLTRADAFSWDAEEIDGCSTEIPASEDWRTVEIELPASERDVIEGFTIIVPQDGVELRQGYYFTEVDPSEIRDVELALCTTTFKKESYIESNIEIVKTKILASDEPVAAHFTQHVVDNGRTLDIEALQSDRVRIYPNDNVGGSGGYARGMIAAMEQQPQATHVLLMDDDVVVQPESIMRTYNLLTLVNAQHQDSFISGAMMDLFEPDVRWEDIGFVTADGNCVPLKASSHIGLLHEVVSNEIQAPRPDVPGYEDQVQVYGGWWYCVIPMTQVKAYGLPLPLFVRYDDIEYALRCHATFMTMNGICLWHPSFVRRYSAAVERYQVTRNAMAAQCITDVAPMADFVKKLYHTVQLELKKFNYTNAELALDGFEDFLKGPAFFEDPKSVEQSFMRANANAEKLIPFKELKAEATSRGIDLTYIYDADSQKASDSVERRSFKDRMIDFVTFNGQRIDMGYIRKGTYAIIDVAGWLYPADRIRRCETIVAADLENQRGVIRSVDRERFKQVWRRYKADVKQFERDRERLKSEYAASRERFTSVSFWKHYLGINE